MDLNDGAKTNRQEKTAQPTETTLPSGTALPSEMTVDGKASRRRSLDMSEGTNEESRSTSRFDTRAPASAYVDYLEVLASKWSSSSAASHITPQLLDYLQPRFHRCSTPIKIRVVLSFLYLSEDSRLLNRDMLLRILAEAEVDRDEWVRKLARLVSSFVVVGSIDVRETDSETAYHLLKFLNTQREKHKLVYLNKPPLEAPHLANVLSEKVMRSECMGSADFAYDQSPFEQPIGQSTSTQTMGQASSTPKVADLFDNFLQRSRICADTTNFQPKIDFLAFNGELMRAGEIAMRKTWKKQARAENARARQ